MFHELVEAADLVLRDPLHIPIGVGGEPVARSADPDGVDAVKPPCAGPADVCEAGLVRIALPVREDVGDGGAIDLSRDLGLGGERADRIGEVETAGSMAEKERVMPELVASEEKDASSLVPDDYCKEPADLRHRIVTARAIDPEKELRVLQRALTPGEPPDELVPVEEAASEDCRAGLVLSD
jgi:hypothetical protein